MSSQDSKIEDYYLIGDQKSAALISHEGSIDWLCLPYFDSPSLFGRLLDPNGGMFGVDKADYQVSSSYLSDTAIVEFKFSSSDVEFTIRDFMVPSEDSSKSSQYLVRKITAVRGSGHVKFTFQPKPNYAQSAVTVSTSNNMMSLRLDEGYLNLRLPPHTKVAKNEDTYEVMVKLKPSASVQLTLEYDSIEPSSSKPPTNLEETTREFWEEWVSKGTFFDFCKDRLVRSAITLKLLQFSPTGAMVAAPTTSLPEEIGGLRNWDYRYVWIRDATFALYAFYVLGYEQEAEHFFDFIYGVIDKCAEDEIEISLMYTIWGKPVPKEKILKHMKGYQNSTPVRTGNEAGEQLQLDVYGSLIDAYYFASKRGLADDEKKKAKSRRLIMFLVKKIDEVWQQPDSGIWEARNDPKHYIYSKAMCWVGVDRAQKLKQKLDLSDKDLQICIHLADTIKDWIWQNGLGKAKSQLLQYPNAPTVDSANFLLVLLQFLDKHEPKTKAIIKRTREELCHKDVFVYRYLSEDGLAGKEGAFVLSSFWMISALAILEDTKEALRLFKKMESYMAPNGLLSEEINPDSGEYLGNYPQAFSHLGYIMSAYYLDRYIKRK